MSEWYWWSKDVKTVVDLSTLTSGTFDPDTGNCIIWSSTDFSLSNHFCDKQLTFLCQRETGYTIKDGDWFSVNGREIAFVSQESTWEAAETVCKGNGGTLAYVTDRNEIDQVLIALERRGFLSPAKIWLGGMYLRDQYKWIWQATDMPIENSLWLSGTAGDPSSYPYDVCIQLYEDFNVGMHYIQNDLCTQEYSFLCQK
ncbi:uncharacterized protein LOC123550313 [Mercenaria mercenaria]|uniref:uncharacterized protein LOC123550313 n=1 Tax=Mercenaria mercenaria TaxID=6596 RepID=UPI00234F562A|nr:uncharacterized protein LOC123550313 [Mercenaria mercenaria]